MSFAVKMAVKVRRLSTVRWKWAIESVQSRLHRYRARQLLRASASSLETYSSTNSKVLDDRIENGDETSEVAIKAEAESQDHIHTNGFSNDHGHMNLIRRRVVETFIQVFEQANFIPSEIGIADRQEVEDGDNIKSPWMKLLEDLKKKEEEEEEEEEEEDSPTESHETDEFNDTLPTILEAAKETDSLDSESTSVASSARTRSNGTIRKPVKSHDSDSSNSLGSPTLKMAPKSVVDENTVQYHNVRAVSVRVLDCVSKSDDC